MMWEEPSLPAVPNQNAPVMKRICVRTRSPRRSSFLSSALWRWTSRSAVLRSIGWSVIARGNQIGHSGQGALIGRFRKLGDDGASFPRERFGALLRPLDAVMAIQDVQNLAERHLVVIAVGEDRLNQLALLGVGGLERVNERKRDLPLAQIVAHRLTQDFFA